MIHRIKINLLKNISKVFKANAPLGSSPKHVAIKEVQLGKYSAALQKQFRKEAEILERATAMGSKGIIRLYE
jgi:hypothetical protein